MAALAFVLFVVIPIIELYVFVLVAGWIGFLPALALAVAASAVGLWLVRREGIGAWRRVQDRVQAGELPTDEVVDGLLRVAAGVLLAVPGFVTAIAGLVLLLPPVRYVTRLLLVRRYARRATLFLSDGGMVTVMGGLGGSNRASSGDATAPGRIRTGPATYDALGGAVYDVREVTPEEPGQGSGQG